MENNQFKINWSIFCNRKLNQAQWRSLKNGPMSLTHPSKKQFKKIRELFLVSKEFLEKFGRRSKQYEDEGKQGEKKLKNHNLSWFQIVCFLEAGTFNPVRPEPEQIAEKNECPAEQTHNATPKPEQIDQTITPGISLEPGPKRKQRESQQDVTRAQLTSNAFKLPNFKRKNLGAPAVTKKRKLRLDDSIDLGKRKNFNETASSSQTNR